MELQGIPYLMPTDAQLISRSLSAISRESARHISILGVSGLKLVVVDGCRDNPRQPAARPVPRSASDTTRVPERDAERQQLGEPHHRVRHLAGEPPGGYRAEQPVHHRLPRIDERGSKPISCSAKLATTW
jgi:hypothetical protein